MLYHATHSTSFPISLSFCSRFVHSFTVTRHVFARFISCPAQCRSHQTSADWTSANRESSACATRLPPQRYRHDGGRAGAEAAAPGRSVDGRQHPADHLQPGRHVLGGAAGRNFRGRGGHRLPDAVAAHLHGHGRHHCRRGARFAVDGRRRQRPRQFLCGADGYLGRDRVHPAGRARIPGPLFASTPAGGDGSPLPAHAGLRFHHLLERTVHLHLPRL